MHRHGCRDVGEGNGESEDEGEHKEGEGNGKGEGDGEDGVVMLHRCGCRVNHTTATWERATARASCRGRESKGASFVLVARWVRTMGARTRVLLVVASLPLSRCRVLVVMWVRRCVFAVAPCARWVRTGEFEVTT